VDGTFQQYCICKADSAVRIPKEYDLELAAPVSLDQAENTVRRLLGTGSLCWRYVIQSNT
jgi:D-arabinose 1-dehydrogenase-like Zn-dependent alcohol dehydrogenase